MCQVTAQNILSVCFLATHICFSAKYCVVICMKLRFTYTDITFEQLVLLMDCTGAHYVLSATLRPFMITASGSKCRKQVQKGNTLNI